MAKIIDVPAPLDILIKYKDGEKTQKTEFKKFLMDSLEFSEPSDFKAIRKLSKIMDKVEASNGTIQLEDAEYEMVQTILAGAKFLPSVGRQLVPFMDAFEKAQDIKVPVEGK